VILTKWALAVNSIQLPLQLQNCSAYCSITCLSFARNFSHKLIGHYTIAIDVWCSQNTKLRENCSKGGVAARESSLFQKTNELMNWDGCHVNFQASFHIVHNYYLWHCTFRPGQVDSQFIFRAISKSHAGRRSFFIFHSTADCSIKVKWLLY